MAAPGSTPIQLYYSTTALAVPLSANLLVGEFGVNVTDKKIYTKNGGGSVIQIAASPGANSDITSLSGLTTPLSISQGGTGGATVSAAQTNLEVDPAGTAVAMAIALG